MLPLPDDPGAGDMPAADARPVPSSCSTGRRRNSGERPRRARRAIRTASSSRRRAPPAVELRGLTKRYGRKAALDGVELTVPVGAIFGFLGPNGAGKTTTLRILGGLARPTAGSAAVLGHDVRERGQRGPRRRSAFCPTCRASTSG